MKICILCDFYYDLKLPNEGIRGGAEVCSKFIAEGLARKGMEVHVVTPNLDEDMYMIESGENLFIHKYKSPLRRQILNKGKSASAIAQTTSGFVSSFVHKMYRRWSARELARAFNNLHHDYNFDLVHANNVESILALKHINIPKTAHLRDYHIFDFKFKADRYIAINQRMKEMAGNLNVEVIHDPADETKISKLSKEEAREKLNLNYKNICLFVGHFMWQTDPTIILELAKELPDIDFVLCGDGPIKVESNLKNIHLIGEVPPEEIKDYYKAADLFLYPAKMDWGFGLTVIESMANGTPVISYPIKGINEVIDDGKNGWITDDLKGQIRKIFGNKDKLNEVGKEALNINQKFNKEIILDQLYGFFQRSVKGEQRTGQERSKVL